MTTNGISAALDPSVPLVELKDVTVELGGRVVLRDVSSRIARGEFVGVIGPNGAGKSTLLRLLLGLVRPVAGEVRFAGEGVRRGDRRIGYSPQARTYDRDPPITGRDLVRLGLDGDCWGIGWPDRSRRERVDRVLAAVGAFAYAAAPIGKLSGGEQQRLSIAQAMVARPSLLLLDEPLASLDLRSEGEIVALVDRLRREHAMTVLFVTHGVNPLLDVLDRVWYVAGGHAEIGSVEHVIQPTVLSRLHGAPVDVVRIGRRVFVSASEECHGSDLVGRSSSPFNTISCRTPTPRGRSSRSSARSWGSSSSCAA